MNEVNALVLIHKASKGCCNKKKQGSEKEHDLECNNHPDRIKFDPDRDNGNPYDNSNSNKDRGGFTNKDKLDPHLDNKSKKDNYLKNEHKTY